MLTGMNQNRIPISLSNVYVVRVFDWEADEYYCWLFFNFAEAWKMFSQLVENTESIFAGGMIIDNSHYYLAQCEECCIQMCPFINEFDETETEDLQDL
jgi:hypothetical protein